MTAKPSPVPTHSQTSHTGGNTKPPFPPFDATTWPSQILWFTIAFGVLYILMARVALPRMAGVLEMRRKRIADDLGAASALQSKAKEAGVAYEKTLTEANARARELARETRAKLAAETSLKRNAVDADLNDKLVAAQTQISDMKAKAMSHVGAIARDATAEIVQHLSGKPADPDAVTAAVAATGT